MTMNHTIDPLASSQLRRSVTDRGTPYYVIIKSVDNEREVVTTDDDSKEAEIRHPYVSSNAWIRTMPSPGIRAVVAYSSDNRKLEVVGYQNNRAQNLSDAYKQGQGLYRQLRDGEHEIMSSGKASTFWGSQPIKVDRAGVISHKLDGVKLESTTRSPTYIWRGTRNRPDVIGHEMRIGVVKRPISASKEVYALKIGSAADAGTAIYATEYLLALNSDLTDTPLIDVRSGEVFDDALTPGYPMSTPRLGSNSLPLRHHAKYYVTIEPGTTGVPRQATEFEVDCLGNMALNLSKLSVIGLAVNVPLGKIAVSSGLDITFDSKTGFKFTTLGKMSFDAKAGFDFTTNGAINMSADMGIQLKSSTSISATATTNVELNGKTGVKLIGALGETGRPISTQPIDPVVGTPNFVDASLST